MDNLTQARAYGNYSNAYELAKLTLSNFNRQFHGTNKKQVESALKNLREEYKEIEFAYPEYTITYVAVTQSHNALVTDMIMSLVDFNNLEVL